MQLHRRLGLIHVFCIASGAMISSGIFVLPGMAFAQAGPAVVVSYALAAMLAATGLLSTAELSTAMPRAGSDYFFITRSVGPAFGTIAGILNWVSFSLKSSFALVGMAALIQVLMGVDMRVSGVILGLLFVGVNIAGVREAARLQVSLVMILLCLMLFYVFRGLPNVNVARFENFAPGGIKAVFSTAGLVFVAFGGLLKVASMAEEVRDPGKTLPNGMILSLVLIGLFYVLMVGVTVGISDPQALATTLTPISDGAGLLMGRTGAFLIGVAASLAFLTTANAGIMAGSRYLLALSRDGIVPGILSRTGTRSGTPHAAILLTGILVILPQFLDLKTLVEAASLGLILTNMLSLVSVVVLRESGIQNYRPTYRAPMYPWLQIAGIAGFGFILVEMQESAFLISTGLAVFGFLIYWFYGRARAMHESALLHIVQRLTSRELVSGLIETELRDIIRERDGIETDRFDSLIESCPVLDITGPHSKDDLFGLAADLLGSRMNVDPEGVKALLVEHEETSSTAISPHLAIPHLVIEGSSPFEVLMVRCLDGIHFSGEAPAVQAAVFLAGSMGERNFHLRSLAAIAQTVQQENFEKLWRRARGEQALRDIFLLARRRREPTAQQ
jgi:amino acid transporter/mannitol/fructose-specific phosphotransferase system IIA component (Ntr-type)